ncbi:hypothetical protein PENSPDRAFT_349148 [Peniophora sp. CONT]|nr:hypothetical protein PENSPDRAFT_349148 [Peniophora sp. CONT]
MSDQGSLFGSPPPSPEGPRTVALALPGAENVGTIALPGSPIRSEHSNELPASRLRTRTDLIFDNDRSDGPATSCAGPSRKRTARERGRESASPAPTRPPPPPLVLPEPGEALPPDLLRGQAALLGHAGLIAGVRPADLRREGRGDEGSATRPIVVPEEVAPPTALPMPKSSTILSALSRSTNLALVLSSLQRTLNESSRSRQSTTSLGGRRSRQEMEEEDEEEMEMEQQQRCQSKEEKDPLAPPPLKRRKLRRVPAGAVDWDVPYPFKEGEGPETYELMWQRDRLRALVAQLVALLKSATRSAAAREYLRRIGADAQGREIALQEARRIGRKHSTADEDGGKQDSSATQTFGSDPLADQAVVEQILAGLYSMPSSSSQASQPSVNPMDDLLALFDSTTTSQDSLFSSSELPSDLNALFDGANLDALLPPSGEFDFSAFEIPLGNDFSSAIPEPAGWDWSMIDPALQPIPPPGANSNQPPASSTHPPSVQHGQPFTQTRQRDASATSTPQLALSPSVSAYSFGPATPHTTWDAFGDATLGLDQSGGDGMVHLGKGKGRQLASSGTQDDDPMEVDDPLPSHEEQTAATQASLGGISTGSAFASTSTTPQPSNSHSRHRLPSLAPTDPHLSLAASRLKEDEVAAAQLAAVTAARQERDAEFVRQAEERDAQKAKERSAQKQAEKRGVSVLSMSTRYPSAAPTQGTPGPTTRGVSTAPSRGSSTAPSVSAADKGKGKAAAPAPAPVTGKKATERSEARAALIERARARKAAIEAELPRANLALWETMIEHTVLAHMIKEATGSVPEDTTAIAESKRGKVKGKARAR